MAKLVYEEWFVKFRFPGHKNVKMISSELGGIPEEWKVDKLGYAVELAYGKSLTTQKRNDGSFPVYGSAGVLGTHNEYMLKGPGIIVGRKGNVGSVFWSNENFFPIDTVFYVKTNIPLHYVYYNLKNQDFINNDAAVPGLNRNQASLLPFLIPDDNILSEFEKNIDCVFKEIDILSRKNQNLRKTRDLLLPKLISGEIDVSDLDIQIRNEF
jgi:type I restriction enzyme S subunit